MCYYKTFNGTSLACLLLIHNEHAGIDNARGAVGTAQHVAGSSLNRLAIEQSDVAAEQSFARQRIKSFQ